MVEILPSWSKSRELKAITVSIPFWLVSLCLRASNAETISIRVSMNFLKMRYVSSLMV